MKYLMFFIFLAGILSCQNTQAVEELEKVKSELNAANEKIESLKAQIEPEGELVHLVFLKVKEEVEMTKLISELKSLAAIEGLKDFELGPFQNLDDSRALSEYDLLMEMSFDNEAAYQKYQADPIHLALKEKLKSMLAGPPATYDYRKR